MSFQVDGKASLEQQELQLQTLETFFVEVVDYNAGAGVKNDITVKNIPGPISSRIHLAVIQTPAELAEIATKASSIVFDRVVFVTGDLKRVVGSRG